MLGFYLFVGAFLLLLSLINTWDSLKEFSLLSLIPACLTFIVLWPLAIIYGMYLRRKDKE